jgi:hypothetical protein
MVSALWQSDRLLWLTVSSLTQNIRLPTMKWISISTKTPLLLPGGASPRRHPSLVGRRGPAKGTLLLP